MAKDLSIRVLAATLLVSCFCHSCVDAAQAQLGKTMASTDNGRDAKPSNAMTCEPLSKEDLAAVKARSERIQKELESGRFDNAALLAEQQQKIRAILQGEACWEVARAGVLAQDVRSLLDLEKSSWPEVAQSFAIQPRLVECLGRGTFAEGERLAREQAAIRERLVGTGSTFTAQSWNNIGLFLNEQGLLSDAEVLYWRGLSVLRETCGEFSPDVAQLTHNLAWLMRCRGSFDESERLYARALAARRVMGSGLVQTLNGFASLYFDTDRVPQAETMYREALEIIGENDPEARAKALDNLAQCALRMNQLTEAESLVNEALEIRKKAPTHPDYFWSLGTLADVKVKRKDFASAEVLLQEALNGRQDRLGSRSHLVADSLQELALVSDAAGDTAKALELARAALDMIEQLRVDVSGDERARAAYSGRLGFSEIGAFLAQLLVRSGSPSKDVLAVIERTRSRELLDLLTRTSEDVTAQAAQQAREIGDTARADRILSLKQQEQKFVEARLAADRQLANAERSKVPDAPALVRDSTVAFRKAADEAADASSALLAEIRTALAQAQWRSTEVITAALEATDFGLAYSWSDKGVVAVYICQGAVNATLVVNNEQEQLLITKVAQDFSKAMVNPATSKHEISKYADQLLDALVPTQIREEMRHAKRIIFIPDGPLNSLPLELVLASDPSLADLAVAYSPSFSAYVSASANRSVKSAGTNHPLVVVADPAFPEEVPPASYDLSTGAAVAVALARGGDLAPALSAEEHTRFAGHRLKRLKGTAAEALAIQATARAAGIPIVIFTGSEATVPATTKAAKDARIIHFATHGLMGSRANPFSASLALTPPKVPTDSDVGFLRLEDLVRDWRGRLAGCELVVLSACDTQSGVRLGGSDFALPWGFFYAGTPAVVATLWPVDDKATTLLMNRFYQNLLGTFESPRVVDGIRYLPRTRMGPLPALRESQSWLRSLNFDQSREFLKAVEQSVVGTNTPRGIRDAEVLPSAPSVDPYAHPYYWAGFVLVGSPGPASGESTVPK